MIELILKAGAKCLPVHVINVEIKDNLQDASKGAERIGELVKEIYANKDQLDDQIETILEQFKAKYGEIILHAVCFY